MSPLTRAEALAVAAILTTHPRRLAHWQGWADRLTAWARTQTAATEEGEMPSQSTDTGLKRGTIERGPSRVFADPQPEPQTTDCKES